MCRGLEVYQYLKYQGVRGQLVLVVLDQLLERVCVNVRKNSTTTHHHPSLEELRSVEESGISLGLIDLTRGSVANDWLRYG